MKSTIAKPAKQTKVVKENHRCLMLATTDDRKFFTAESHYPELIEFGNKFGAEISVVKVESAEILELPSLAIALCDPNYMPSNTELKYEVIETKMKSAVQKNSVKDEIKKILLTGSEVFIAALYEKWADTEDYSKVYNSFKRACAELVMAGHTISHIERGKYQLVVK